MRACVRAFVLKKEKLPYQPTKNIYDNDKVSYSTLECKDHVKYLGILIDKNLNWKVHIDLIALKISKAIGMIAKLRHSVPLSVLVKLYQSLISPCFTYGISLWGQASQSNLEKLLLLQKPGSTFDKLFLQKVNTLFVTSLILTSYLFIFSMSNMFPV